MLAVVQPNDMVDIKLRLWGANHSSTIVATERGLTGSTINARQDIGMETSEEVIGVDISSKIFHNSLFNVSVISGNYNGSKRLERDLIFAGTLFQGNWLTSSDLKYTLITAGFEYDFKTDLTDQVKLGFGIEGGGLYDKITAELSASNLPVSFGETETSKLLSYIIGVKLRVHISEWAKITGSLKMSSINNIRETDLSFLDMTLEGSLNIYSGLSISAGLKRITWDQADTRAGRKLNIDTTMSGPFIGLGYSF